MLKNIRNSREKSHYRKYPIVRGERRFYIVILLLCGFLQGGLAIGFSFFISGILQNLRITSAEYDAQQLSYINTLEDNYLIYFFILTGIGILAVTIKTIERLYVEKIGQSFVVEMRHRIYRHLLLTDLNYSEKFSNGSKMLRFVTDLSGLNKWVSFGLSRLLVSTTMIGTVLVALFTFSPILTLATILPILTGIMVCIFISPSLSRAINEVRKHRARLAATVNDRINSVATVQASGQTERELKRVRRLSQNLKQPLVKRAEKIGLIRGILESTSYLTVGSILLSAIYLYQANTLDTYHVFTTLVLAGLTSSPLRDLARVMEYWQDWRISHEKIAQFLATPKLKSHQVSVKEQQITGDIQLRKLCIKTLLTATTLTIKSGERIFLEGENGVGKTTLLFTIAGLLRPSSGKATLDSVESWQYRQSPKKGGIGIISPDLVLMRGSILRNLTYANTKATQYEIDEVLKRCNLYHWIQALPQKLNTRLSEGGQNLSSGQRQCLILARVLLAKPRILILDEFDTHIDQASIDSIQKALIGFSGTIIQVNHHTRRPIFTPTRIWQLKNQSIIEKVADGDIVHA